MDAAAACWRKRRRLAGCGVLRGMGVGGRIEATRARLTSSYNPHLRIEIRGTRICGRLGRRLFDASVR
jgi:hypothetical protein